MIFEVKILKFEEYNARQDIKSPSWFRMRHDLFDNPKFYHFTLEEKAVLVYILCQASKQNEKGIFTANSEYFHRTQATSPTVFNSAIKKLQQMKVLEIRTLRGRYVDVTQTCATLHDTTLHDTTLHNNTEYMCDKRTERQNDVSDVKFDIESIYSVYPKRKGASGKKPGIQKLTRIVKDQETFDEILRGVKNYKTFCDSEYRDKPEMIRMFSTFVNQETWKEFQDDNKFKKLSFTEYMALEGEPIEEGRDYAKF